MRETEQVVEDIKYSLFDDKAFDHELKFVTWTGNQNSFIVEKDGKEYRITVTQEN